MFHLLSYIKSWNLEGFNFFQVFIQNGGCCVLSSVFVSIIEKIGFFHISSFRGFASLVSLSVHRCGFDMMTTERRRKAQFACQPINIHHYCVFHFTELLFLLVNGGLLAGGRNFGFAPGKSIDLGSHYHRASSRTQPEN